MLREEPPVRVDEPASVAEPQPEPEWADPPPRLPATFHSLAYRDFRFLWVGQVSHALALWMDLVGRPLLVVAISGSAVHLGLVTMLRGAPTIFLSPLAGVLADRADRRVIMIVVKLLQTLVTLVFVALMLTGQLELWHVYATAVILSVFMSFDQPARHALLPSLVPPSLLTNAVALTQGTMQFTRIISASLAGFVIALWALAFGFSQQDAQAFSGVYLIVSVAYLAGAIATYFIRVPAGGRVQRNGDPWMTSLMEGFRFAWRNPVILGIFLLFAVQSAFGMPYLIVFIPWIATEVMDIGSEGAGMLVSLSGLGSLVGAMAVANAGGRMRRRGQLIVTGVVLYGVTLVALGLTSLLPLMTVFGLLVPVVPMLVVIFVGLGQTALMTVQSIVLLEMTPHEMRGRIMSLLHMDRGFSTLGGGAAGFAIALLGGPFALALFGVACVGTALLVGVFSPRLRETE